MREGTVTRRISSREGGGSCFSAMMDTWGVERLYSRAALSVVPLNFVYALIRTGQCSHFVQARLSATALGERTGEEFLPWELDEGNRAKSVLRGLKSHWSNPSVARC